VKRKSEIAAAKTTLLIGDEVLIDSGRIVWTVDYIDGNVITVVQRSNLVGALKYAPKLDGGATEAKVSRKVDIYRLTKVEG
jgi:pyruvate kinase